METNVKTQIIATMGTRKAKAGIWCIRVLAGDISAFEGIVRRWQGPLVNLAYRFCRDRGRAEEMAQEAFLRVYRKLDRWHSDSLFSSWMFAVAINLYRSEL